MTLDGLADPPIITPYFTLCCPLLEEWHCVISLAHSQLIALSHDKICDILMWGLNMISQQLAQLPPPALSAPLSTPESTIALLPPPAPPSTPELTITPLSPPTSTLQRVAIIAVLQTVPPIPSSVPPSPPTVAQLLPDLSLAEESQMYFSLVVLESPQFKDEEVKRTVYTRWQWKRRGAVEISDSEVNPMAPLQQLKKEKKKADTNFLPRSVEDGSSQSNTQHHNLFLCMAGPDDMFGFKSSSTDKQDPWEATQAIGHSFKKATGKSVEDEARKDRMWDSDECDESENNTDEHDHNDQPSEDEDSLLWDIQK
ncbi:hypothetical protein CY34DRAFT_14784 [Suillus luteus UH-Slu-Lm8-n1]|uniref:Uncharacterized protein n=1 Tax=Suillus luteus UH-Slu-Lm8-n1 TaxID=930992 RepID=A0A0D0AWT2_9AGAM|nr:hypothetical protein CY34DRAFT_14784 [Suillus luteus UH-Slu-Lm8-n1]